MLHALLKQKIERGDPEDEGGQVFIAQDIVSVKVLEAQTFWRIIRTGGL